MAGSASTVDNRSLMVRASRVLAAALLAVGICSAATQPASAASRPPKLQYRNHHVAQRAHGHPVGGSLDADRPRADRLPRGIEERAARPHRLRPSVRTPDVQGLEERPAGGAHLDARVGRRPEQRLHDRRRDGVLGDRAVAVPAADVVARGRPDGDAAHRPGHVRQRARRGQGRAADARGQPAVRPPERDHLRPGVHRAPLQARDDWEHGGSRSGLG